MCPGLPEHSLMLLFRGQQLVLVWVLDSLDVLAVAVWCWVLQGFYLTSKQIPSLRSEIDEGDCVLSGSEVTSHWISWSDGLWACSESVQVSVSPSDSEEEFKILIVVHMPSGLYQNHLSCFPFEFLPPRVTVKQRNFQENFSLNSQACEMFQVWRNLFHWKRVGFWNL